MHSPELVHLILIQWYVLPSGSYVQDPATSNKHHADKPVHLV